MRRGGTRSRGARPLRSIDRPSAGPRDRAPPRRPQRARSASANGREGAIRPVQTLASTVSPDDRDVLDPDPEPAREVDAGLEREGHPRLEELIVAAHEIRMLVAVETDAVPETMDEEVAVPRLRDDRPCRCVDRSRGRALVRGVVSRLLRAANDVVDLHGLGAGTASDLH